MIRPLKANEANDVSQAQLEKGRKEQNRQRLVFLPQKCACGKVYSGSDCTATDVISVFAVNVKPKQRSSLISTKGGWLVQLFDGVDR